MSLKALQIRMKKRWTGVQSNGPKSIANKNEKEASKIIGSPLLEARIQEKNLKKDQAHVRRWIEVQSNGPKNIANKNEKEASKIVGCPLLEARILKKDQGHTVGPVLFHTGPLFGWEKKPLGLFQILF